jgi:hypothetical protein
MGEVFCHRPAVAETMARRAHADQPPRKAMAWQADTDIISHIRLRARLPPSPKAMAGQDGGTSRVAELYLTPW